MLSDMKASILFKRAIITKGRFIFFNLLGNWAPSTELGVGVHQ